MDALNKILSSPLFNIGDTQITLGTLLATCIVVITTLLIAQLVQKSVYRFFNKLGKKEGPESIEI